MTEDEASRKWCPFAASRVVTCETTGGMTMMNFQHRPDQQGPTVLCIASDCMAWRPDGGYCGLAGKP